jgi:hypothetical protein
MAIYIPPLTAPQRCSGSQLSKKLPGKKFFFQLFFKKQKKRGPGINQILFQTTPRLLYFYI